MRDGRRADLTKLSLDAAIEFEKSLRGQEADQTTIDALAAQLRAGFPNDEVDGSAKLFCNLPAVDLYARAWERVQTESATDIKDVIAQLLRLVEEAVPSELDQHREALERMKSFCLYLHEELISVKVSRRLQQEPSASTLDAPIHALS